MTNLGLKKMEAPHFFGEKLGPNVTKPPEKSHKKPLILSQSSSSQIRQAPGFQL